MLRQVILNAEANADKAGTGRRHPLILKKFATALFIYAGPLAYEFLQQNMPEALPSIRTVQRNIHEDYVPLEEGHFRFDELAEHIRHHNGPSVVAIVEDATRVIARVDYDNETDQCVGFVLPIDKNGLPITDSFKAKSFEAISKMFSASTLSRYAYVYMPQPLHNSVPPFCLACNGNDNKFTADQVLQRWRYIQKECGQRGIHVVSYGGDGDSCLMKAMKVTMRSTLPKTEPLRCTIPKSTLPIPEIPTEWKSWYIMDSSSIAYVQDTVYIAVKLKARL